MTKCNCIPVITKCIPSSALSTRFQQIAVKESQVTARGSLKLR